MASISWWSTLLPGRLADLRDSTRKELNATSLLPCHWKPSASRAATDHPTMPSGMWTHPIWAGVVPLTLTAGEPEPAPDMVADIPLPGYVKQVI